MNVHGENGTAQSRLPLALPAAHLAQTDDPERGSEPLRQPLRLDVGSVVLAGSPRLTGENKLHTRMLAEVGEKLPPILVHRATRRVIDGVHRVQAARLRGEATIKAVLYDGDDDAAFVCAVKANVSHGLPLTLADRRAAAKRILSSYPVWSDRAVAEATGLSATTVRAIRGRTTERSAQLNARMGRDGRIRPVNATDGRRHAARVIAERPDASLREIANSAGVSIGTARDVRKRLSVGESPVPISNDSAGLQSERGGNGAPRSGVAAGHNHGGAASRVTRAPSAVLEGLKKDPSLRYSERGRSVVRWLDEHLVMDDDGSRIAAAVPPHCVYTIAEYATACAAAWERIAEALMVRARSADQPRGESSDARS